MTFYELLCETQHRECDLAESYYADMFALPCGGVLNPIKTTIAMAGIKDHTDRAHGLSRIIDALPVEIAEREV